MIILQVSNKVFIFFFSRKELLLNANTFSIFPSLKGTGVLWR